MNRRGFTLVESMLAMAILGIAGAALLIGTASNASTTRDALERTIALGMAQQLLDEILGMRYCEIGVSPTDSSLTPNASEVAGGARKLFDDIDDYNGVRTTPATDRYGKILGTDDGRGGTRYSAFQVPADYFVGWKQNVDVQYVSETNFAAPLSSGVSNYRRIRVWITVDQADGRTRTLADLTRVVANVPGA